MNKTEVEAMKRAMQYEKDAGRYPVKATDKNNPEHRGIDIISSINGQVIRRIEVKGTSKDEGIPDAFETELDDNKKLVADYLYVVINADKPNHRLIVIPKEEVDKHSENHTPSSRFTFSKDLKKAMKEHRFDDYE